MKEKTSFIDNFIDGITNLIYSDKRKEVRFLIVLTIIGFLIRLIASLNLDVFADDMIYASQSAGIIDSAIISTHSNPVLFFYLTDFAYNLLGYTTFASRFWPLIMGTMSIPLVFIITRKLFNNKIAIYAAFFATFSNFLIRMTFTEQSLVVFFFSFLGVYEGINYLENRKMSHLIVSSSIFGLALLTKYNAPFFILSFFLFSLVYLKFKNEKIMTSQNFKHGLIFIAILFLFALPFLSFNYFIYQDKGILDVYFSRVISLNSTQELYGSLAGQSESFFTRLTNPSSYTQFKLPFITDFLISLFAIFGIMFMVKDKRKIPLIFIGVFLILPFILQSAGSGLQKHFAFMLILLSIPAGYSLDKLISKHGKLKLAKILILLLLSAGMLASLGISYGTPPNYISQSATSQLKSYINDNVGPNDLIVLDSRIYGSRNFWLATPHSFILSDQFPQFFNSNSALGEQMLKPTKIFVVECLIDDCGWGWVHNNQNFNQTNEEILALLSTRSVKAKTINADVYSGNEFFGDMENTEIYRVSGMVLNLNPSLVSQAKAFQSFYFAPYLYQNMNGYIYNYDLSGPLIFVEKLSIYIIYLSMILSVLSIFYLIGVAFLKE